MNWEVSNHLQERQFVDRIGDETMCLVEDGGRVFLALIVKVLHHAGTDAIAAEGADAEVDVL